MKKTVLLFSTFLFQFAFAGPFQNFPGSVPLKYERQAASDLVFNGKVLLPDEARQLYESGKISDLSQLNPNNSDIWSHQNTAALSQPTIDIDKNAAVEYLSETEVPLDTIAFVASQNRQGKIKTYQVWLGVKSHNVLLRRNLLIKLGYKIPSLTWLPELKVKFKSEFTKREFLKDIQRRTFLESSRWISAEPSTNELTIRDIVVFEGAEDKIYNLAKGSLSAGVIRGRRVLNSLLIPFSLTDTPESINVFSWTPARIFNDQLLFNYEDAAEFSTSYEDARWITRKILALNRNEWSDIVRNAYYPNEVATLLTEKLIARRNELRQLLSLDKEFNEIPINSKISSGERLQNGKLVGPIWEGYASRFAATDPESPLSGEELWALGKSKGITNFLSNLLFQFNDRFVPRTDLAWKIIDHNLDIAADQLAHFILTGEVKKVPFGFWTTPIYNANLIASREIVAGNYLGAENIVQVADGFGYAIDLGLYIGADGLPDNKFFNGQAKLFLVKQYTHLKPIRSIKASLKEDYKNIVVPWLMGNIKNPIEQLVALEKQKDLLSEEVFAAQLKENLELLKAQLQVGESIIVTTSFGTDLNLSPGMTINASLDLYAKFQSQLSAIQRLHIYRKDENTIQVYKDPAHMRIREIGIGLEALKNINVLELSWSKTKGGALTEFYQIPLDEDLSENPLLFENMLALLRVFKDTKTDVLKRVQKPLQIEHEFLEKQFKVNFFWQRYLSQKSRDEIRVTHPKGVSKEFIRRTQGRRTGSNFEALSVELLNTIMDELTDSGDDIRISTEPRGNPGDTFKGKSVSRKVTLESEYLPSVNVKPLDLERTYLAIDYRWKGWQIKQDRAQEILNDITKKYGREIFPKLALNETQKIQFYSIDVNLSLYQEGVEHLLRLTDQKIKNIFERYSIVGPRPSSVSISQRRNDYVRQFQSLLTKIAKKQAAGDGNEASDALIKLVNLAESTLSHTGFVELVGGDQNYFVRGTIKGFRVGDENGDNDIISHTLGQIGSEEPSGPLRTIQRNMGITEGEFFIYWLLNRL